MEPEQTNPADPGVPADPPAMQGITAPAPAFSAELSPLESPAEPLLPPCPVPVEVPHDSTVPEADSATPTRTPADDPPPEPCDPAPAGRRLSTRSPWRGRGDHLGPIQRTLFTLAGVLLILGVAGWGCRWRVLREVLLQIDAARLPAHAVTRVDPLLCVSLLESPSGKRRMRAAELLVCSARSDGPPRGEAVWEALLEALRDPDPKVAYAAWLSLDVGATPDPELGLVEWFSKLPASRCVQVLSDTRSALVRWEFLATLRLVCAREYTEVARWALRSLDDSKTTDQVLNDLTLGVVLGRGGVHMIDWTGRANCLIAGLENPSPGVRDRCRRLFLEHLREMGVSYDVADWIRTTKDVPTIETILRTLQGSPSGAWGKALESRLAEERDFETAVHLSLVVESLVEDGGREYLEAGLRNPDPRIREYFEQLQQSWSDRDAPPDGTGEGR